MAIDYRNKFSAYKQETDGQYQPVGTIVPFLVDLNSGDSGEDPAYSYRNFLYCDGRTLNIREHPHLYNCIGNTYGGAPEVEKTQPSQAGGITKLYYINGKAFINIKADASIAGPVKMPYPYGVLFRPIDNTGGTTPGNGLGGLDSNFAYNTFYGTKAPTEDVTSQVPQNGSEFAYEIVFASTAAVSGSTVVFTAGNHPYVKFRKTFNFRDYPYNVGTFNLPDYRDRIITGYGAVDGDGSPTIENALINNVGQTGGRWFISQSNLLDGGVFFNVGNVKTTGYTNIAADIFTNITGSVEFTIGPIDDHIFSRPVEHFHYILSSEPDEGLEAEFGTSPSDQYAVLYTKTRANLIPFEPQGSNGLALGHSHGLLNTPLNDPRMATYGNTAGIGGEDPNVPADVNYDVNDPVLTSGATYTNVSLENYGTGTGEIGGFAAPSVTDRGDKYLAFGYDATGTYGGSQLLTSRSVRYVMDFTGYTQLYIFAISGNDSNGGERVNDPGEGLRIRFSDGSEDELIPSAQDFKAQTGSTGFSQYDAIYTYWTQNFVPIPTALQTANQAFEIFQNLDPTVEQKAETPPGNDNANDMVGIQAIGLRGGIPEDPPDPNGTYPVTGSPIVTIASITYEASLGYALATSAEPHGFDTGMVVEISGSTDVAYNGAFEVLSDQLTGTTFTYTPVDTPVVSPAPGLITAKIATGTFTTETSIPDPRTYVIDGNTVIGGKPDEFEIPGTGVIFQSDDRNTPGTINMNAVTAGAGEEFSQITINLVAPGGGGADSGNDGGDGGYAYATFNWKGTNRTVYAYGGDGGQRGSNGGNGGSGGTILIPQVLIDDPDFTYSSSNGLDGSDGGGTGTDGSNISGGGTDNAPGTGGDGKSEASTSSVTGNWSQFNSSGTWNAPAIGSGETGRTILFELAGGGGAGGNPNGNSGCNNSANGGSGNGGALISGSFTVLPSSIGYTIGNGGIAGFNNVDGFINGTGYEASGTSGGNGAAVGGDGGQGAWGNGATAGSGGGASGMYFNGGNAIVGAGGGGGGGGSGGGFNGGGTTDGCYAGGNAAGADTNLHSQSSALDFNNGGNGSSSGCTSGGGGGGGAGCGPATISSGGTAGVAGVGHNGNGGGTGGDRGDSAYRNDYVNATFSTASNGGSPGNNGGKGYFRVRVDTQTLSYGSPGGGGGQGAQINFSLIGQNVSVVAGLQNRGSGGGDGTDGENGSISVTYYGSEGGETVTGEFTEPAGKFYEGDPPGGSAFDGNVWLSSTADGDSETNALTPVNPGTGTGNASGFSFSSGSGAPSYNGLATKYIPFSGPGTREYVVGPINMTNVEQIKFSIIRGSNFNGGEQPDESVIAYWRQQGSTTTNLLETIMDGNDPAAGWTEKVITIPEGANVKQGGIELILRQTRSAGIGDNATNNNDNYGISAIQFVYQEVTTQVFTPSDGNTISDVDFVTEDVTALDAGLISGDGQFVMSSSTPISTTALVSPENDIPLITKYHRVKYLIKAL